MKPASTRVTPDAWRGRAADQDSERTAAEAPDAQSMVRLRARSRRLLGGLLRPRWRLLTVTVLLLLVQNFAATAGPYLVRLGIDHGIPPITRHGDYTMLAAIGAAFILSAVVDYLTKRGFLTLSGRLGQAILLELRRRVFAHFQRLSVAFHERYTSGRVISRLTSDMDAIDELASGSLSDLVLSVLSMLTVAVVLLWLDWPLALVALLATPFLLWLSMWFRHNSTIAYRRTRDAVAMVIVYFVESLGGVRAVHAFRRERRNQQIFETVNHEYRSAHQRTVRLNAVFAPGIKLIGNVSVAAVLVFGAWRVMRGETEVGVLAAFVLYLRRFFEPVQELSAFYNSLQSATAALEKLAGVLDEKPDVPPARRPRPLPTPRGELVFDQVSFGYRADQPVLREVGLTIPAGQVTALVGATGSGKTTIAKLVSRFYDPTSGAVRLDGVDLRELTEPDLRRAVVMVTQENVLFSQTIAENIAFGRPDASRAEIEEAARTIGADPFIRALPDGYDTQLGKRGGRLSAGQRQLVAFARAFLADPAVLILDEATSLLDIPSERLVQRALRTILAGRTAIVIAHRLSTVEIADRVLVVEAGRIVEDGPPGDLVRARGRYAALHSQWRDSLEL